MILLKFLDGAGDEDKLVPLDQVAHFADMSGKLHMVTVDGAEHVAASSIAAMIEALAQVPHHAAPIVIIGL